MPFLVGLLKVFGLCIADSLDLCLPRPRSRGIQAGIEVHVVVVHVVLFRQSGSQAARLYSVYIVEMVEPQTLDKRSPGMDVFHYQDVGKSISGANSVESTVARCEEDRRVTTCPSRPRS